MNKCLICFEDIDTGLNIYDYLFKEDCICGNCRRKMIVLNKSYDFLCKVRVLYLYNDYLESLLFQYKEGRDIALKNIFLMPFIKYIEKKYKDYTIVYMPSHKDKIKERTFFPLEYIFENVHLNKLELFDKKYNIKQSKQKNRNTIQDFIILKDHIKLPNTNILLVDDVITSGNTLVSAYNLIKNHPYKIEAFIISAHPYFISKWDSI